MNHSIKRRCLPVSFALLLFITSTAQRKKNGSAATTGSGGKGAGATAGVQHLKVGLIGKGYEDSVVIRWAPTNPEGWILGNEAGYHLTRIDISSPGQPVTTDLGPQFIQPMPEKQIMAGLDTTSEKTKYLTVAAKMLYGKQFSTLRRAPRSFMDQAKGQHGALVLRYATALMAADYYPPAADALGLRWVDRKVKPGGKYVYVLSSPISDKNYKMDSSSVFVNNIKTPKERVPK